MKVSDAMTRNIEILLPSATLKTAAQKMKELDCGFLPIATEDGNKLSGVVTDRDLVVRGLADGLGAEDSVEQVKSEKLLYCFSDDDIENAAHSMREQKVYRLVVLNNSAEKQLCGIISLGDVMRQDEINIASETAKKIIEAA